MNFTWNIKSASNLLLIGLIISSLFTMFQSGVSVSADGISYEPWNFVAMGDGRNWEENTTNPIRKSVIENIVTNNPDMEFILNSGDMTLSGGEQNEWDIYYEDIELAIQNNVTYYYAVGNHETYTYRLEDGSYGPQELNFSTYMKNVEMPGNERYYSFDHNQIHFIIINTEEFWNRSFLGLTTEQEAWIIDDLSSNQDANLTIAMFHRPCYSIRSDSRVADASVIRETLTPILLEYGVDVVFSGHDHYYFRTTRQGITYFTTGGAGAPLYTPTATGNAIEGDVYFDEYHYINVTVTNEEITFETMVFSEDFQDVVIEDTFTISLLAEEPQENSLYLLPVLVVFVALVVARRHFKR